MLLWAYVCTPGECSPYMPSLVYLVNCVFDASLFRKFLCVNVMWIVNSAQNVCTKLLRALAAKCGLGY
jgi:hypothetical protein